MTEQRASNPMLSEYDRLQAEYAKRYYVVREGLMWHVKCGTGTQSLMKFFRERNAWNAAARLHGAFQDGMFVVKSQLRGGGRYA